MTKQILSFCLIAIITVIIISGLLESQAFAETKAMRNYDRGFADGCTDRQTGAENGPTSLLKTTAGPHGHSQPYLTGWDDGYSYCF